VETLARTNAKEFHFPDSLWTRSVYHFLLAFNFNKDFTKGDMINAFVPLFEGYLAAFALTPSTNNLQTSILTVIPFISTTMPERYYLTTPLLAILQAFAGTATTAVSFTMRTIN
jgi:hypothetical protein